VRRSANVGEVCNLAFGRSPERGRCRALAALQSEIANLAYVAASVLAGGPGAMALGCRLRWSVPTSRDPVYARQGRTICQT
jgi:hypothetical protein